jgi:hypothetical protein
LIYMKEDIITAAMVVSLALSCGR